jgi:hypothetical protein
MSVIETLGRDLVFSKAALPVVEYPPDSQLSLVVPGSGDVSSAIFPDAALSLSCSSVGSRIVAYA